MTNTYDFQHEYDGITHGKQNSQFEAFTDKCITGIDGSVAPTGQKRHRFLFVHTWFNGCDDCPIHNNNEHVHMTTEANNNFQLTTNNSG